jgi:hypothetical protein
MRLHEIWRDEDNKKIVGKPDSIYVSRTEGYELRYFIESILDEASKPHTDGNKQAVLDAILSFPGKAPILRTDLTAHVLRTVRWPVAAPKIK